jgi:sugar-specific transcriptional regulator TrmB
MLEVLEEIGLTKSEIKAYKGILELGRCKTGELCNHTNIRSSNIYGILNLLQEKGLVTFTTENGIKFFEASPVETIRSLFEAKKEELNQKEKNVFDAIEHLKKIKNKEEHFVTYNYFEGIPAIKAGTYKLLENMEKFPDKIVKIEIPHLNEHLRLTAFYNDFHVDRIKKKINVRFMIDKEYKKLANNRKKQKFTEIKIKDTDSKVEWGIYGDSFYIQSRSKKKPFMIIINEPYVAETFEKIFDKIWDEK